jgi:hypothetical protein
MHAHVREKAHGHGGTPDEADGVYIEKTDPQARQRKPPPGIQGWGADLDPAVRPAVPMERTPPRLENVHWDAPAEQPRHIKVFHSTERPGITPVFGTSTPPTGISGAVRGVAYKYAENDMRHWLLLLLADRVNVVEGLVDDLAHGHVPNIYKEMGGPSEWRHNRHGFMRKAVIAGGVVGLLLLYRNRRRQRH